MYAALNDDYPDRMRRFISGADIITPNITEACLLTRRGFNPCPTLHETKEMLLELCDMGVKFAVITGFSEKGLRHRRRIRFRPAGSGAPGRGLRRGSGDRDKIHLPRSRVHRGGT